MDDKEVFAALAAALKPMNTTKDIAGQLRHQGRHPGVLA